MDKIYLGSRLESLEISEPLLPISRVILKVDGQNIYTAGDDSGRTIEKTMSWATQEMADSILTSLKGQVYKPFTGSGAFLDPAAELGDAITVAGNYGMLAGMSRQLDRMGISEISAPGADELDDEFPYTPKSQREVERVLAKSYSRISKTADQILLKVEDELDGLSASIDVQLGSITNQVNGLGDAVSTVSQTANKINWLVASGTSASDFTMTDRAASLVADKIDLTGFVTFSNLSTAGETTIDGGNIKANSTITAPIINGGEIRGAEFYGNQFNVNGSIWPIGDGIFFQVEGGRFENIYAAKFSSPMGVDAIWDFDNTVVNGTVDFSGATATGLYLRFS